MVGSILALTLPPYRDELNSHDLAAKVVTSISMPWGSKWQLFKYNKQAREPMCICSNSLCNHTWILFIWQSTPPAIIWHETGLPHPLLLNSNSGLINAVTSYNNPRGKKNLYMRLNWSKSWNYYKILIKIANTIAILNGKITCYPKIILLMMLDKWYLLLGQFHVRFKTSEEGLMFKINTRVLVGKGNIWFRITKEMERNKNWICLQAMNSNINHACEQ